MLVSLNFRTCETCISYKTLLKAIEEKLISYNYCCFFQQGKGLFALRLFKEGDTIFEEKPFVCCQFSWNAEYGYLACDNCMSPLENAEENARRLSGKRDIILPYPECCETKKEFITECEACGVKYCSNECKSEALQRYNN